MGDISTVPSCGGRGAVFGCVRVGVLHLVLLWRTFGVVVGDCNLVDADAVVAVAVTAAGLVHRGAACCRRDLASVAAAAVASVVGLRRADWP